MQRGLTIVASRMSQTTANTIAFQQRSDSERVAALHSCEQFVIVTHARAAQSVSHLSTDTLSQQSVQQTEYKIESRVTRHRVGGEVGGGDDSGNLFDLFREEGCESRRQVERA